MAASTTLTPEERTQRARLAAQVRWSRESPEANVARMRAGMERRFLDEVDPDRVLPEAERLRRAESARRAFFTRLAFKSSKARAQRRGGVPSVPA